MRVQKFPRRSQRFQFQRWLSFRSWIRVLGAGFLGLVFFCFFYSWFFLPSVKNAAELSFSQSTIIYDRGALEPGATPEDHVLYTVHGEENRAYTQLEDINPWVIEATLAIEDDRFYRHLGFDGPALVKVFLHEAFGIGPKRGGSTITQQLAKQVFLSSERSYTRKFKELLLAFKLEWHYSKDEILELYLNKIPYGNNAFGIEAAAQTYFDKSARDLTVIESAILVSIPVAPTRFNPYGSNRDLLMGYYEYAEPDTSETLESETTEDEAGPRTYKKGRKDLVLQRMLELKKISQKQFQIAWVEAHELEFRRSRVDIRAPHFVFLVRNQLEQKYGKEFLAQGGLRIYTTLDPSLQDLAEETIKIKTSHYANTYEANNVALVSINPDNGEIMAYIGGKDFFDREQDGQVDILTSRRQPGSSFKPFVVAAAFEKMSPGDILFDAETDFGGGYQPQNFDQKFRGPVSLRRALNESLNIPLIKLAYLASPAKVLALAESLGIKYDGDADTHGVAIGVGVAEVEPLSHINAYQAFVNEGKVYNPQTILEVRNADGKILESFEKPTKPDHTMLPEPARLVQHILTDETTRPTTDGFDWNQLLQLEDLDNGAKTGTSNRVAKNPDFDEEKPETEDNLKFITVPGDSWTVGFTPHLVTGVWVGNNRGQPMKSGSTGLTVAAPVWKAFMNQAHGTLAEQGSDLEKAYETKVKLTEVQINKLSGKLANETTPEHLKVTEVYSPLNLQNQTDELVQEVNLNLLNGEIAEENMPRGLSVKHQILDYRDYEVGNLAWESGVKNWLADHREFIVTLGQTLHWGDEDEVNDGELYPTKRPSITDLISPNLSPGLQRQLRNWQARRPGEVFSGWNPSNLRGQPSVKILSPTTQIAAGRAEVRVQTQSSAPIEVVEYYLDDQLVYQAKNAPFHGKISIEPDGGFEPYQLKVVLVDQNFGVAEDQVTLQLATDTSGPEVIFLGPFAQSQLPIYSQSEFRVQATDNLSEVASVEFFQDGKSLGVNTAPPFVRTVTFDRLGRSELKVKATDTNGNITEKIQPVIVVRQPIQNSNAPFIDSINRQFRSHGITVVFPEPDKIVQAKLVVNQPGHNVYQTAWRSVANQQQVFVDKTLARRGTATVTLYAQYQGQGGLKKVGQRTVEF